MESSAERDLFRVSYADFCRSLGLHFLSIVVFYSRFQIYLDTDPKANMMSLSVIIPPWSHFPKHSFVGSV
jgi:hypothetical protein